MRPMRVSLTLPSRRRGWLCLLLLLGLAWAFQLHSRQLGAARHGSLPGEVVFDDATAAAGLERYSETFGVAVADIDNDGHDDLIISNHNKPPSLFLYQNGAFIDRSDLLPDRVLSDWHGIAAVDLDNDGDKDLIIAGGGTDGIGRGEKNRLFRNMLTETGRLGFEDVTGQVGVAYRPWRTRQFLPLASPDGSHVDLYMVGLARPDCPNLYLSNRSGRDIILTPDPNPGLNQIMGSEGFDLFFDYDRDGDQDLIMLKQFRPVFYERRPDGYHRVDAMLPDIGGIVQISAGDLNNDGYPDLYLSSYPPFVHSDNISYNDREIHFVIEKQKDDHFDEFTFDTPDPSIEIDFVQHTPGNPITSATDIFIGPSKTHPRARHFALTPTEAEGKPVVDTWGTYVWKDTGSDRWHVRWQYGENPGPYKGRIIAPSLSHVETADFETFPPAPAEDMILINQQGKGFKKLDTIDLRHTGRTRCTAMVDLNNDGLLDIIGIRGSEQGRFNGTPFVLINRGGLKFELQTVMDNPKDHIYQADQLVVGFFNDDGLPDIFFTNGNALNPGNLGLYELYLNKTGTDNDYVILKLRGTKCNRDAIGAEVELYSSQGKFLGYRQVGMGFNRDQSSLKVHFGLGHAGPAPLKVKIRWPGASAWDERSVIKNSINEISQ